MKITKIKEETATVEMDFKTLVRVTSFLGVAISEPKQRTISQNSAMHKYFTMVADSLNDAGLDIKKTLRVDVPWSSHTVKEIMWKGIQKPLLHKESTTNLSTEEVAKIYEVMNRFISQRFGIHIPFPSQ